MASTILGKVSVTPTRAWSNSTDYDVLDIVSNNGSSYIAKQSVPAGTALSDTSYWLLLAQKGDKGDKGDTGATGATGATGNGISSVEVEETSVVGNVHTYTLTISMTDGTSEVFTYEVTDGAVTSVNGKTGDVTGVAMDDGYYENMTVGSADQLISSVNIEDKVPYVFRTSGGANDIGDREVDEIGGGTIAWNQLSQDSKTESTVYGLKFSCTNGLWSFAGEYTGSSSSEFRLGNSNLPIPAGHKVLLLNTSPWKVRLQGGAAYVASTAPQNRIVIAGDGTLADIVVCPYGQTSGDVINFTCRFGILDLTQMFGSTIADYIFSLEQANAGAGVAWFKSLFPKPYYPYNAGELISVSGLSAHKMTGFNQWDEEWEVGQYLVNTGEKYSDTTRIRCKNPIPVMPNTTYYFKTANQNINVCYYDANMNFILNQNSFKDTTKTTPSNCHYLCFNMGQAYGTTYKNDICINLHWDGERNGEYEPYVVHSYALDSLTLRGIPKLDADNKLYYDGDVYASDGTVQRRYGIVDLGSLTYTYDSSAPRFYVSNFATTYGAKTATNSYSDINNAICIKYIASYTDSLWNASYDKVFNIASTGTLSIKDTAYSDATTFKNSLSGVYLVYELATPTTESAEPYTAIQQVSNWGTEEYVIAEQNGVALPVGHLTRYTQDLKAKLEMAPQSPSEGNGDYVVRQTNGINEYVKLVIPTELPTAPSSDGNYTLKCTVSGSTVTYTWESAT